VQFAHWRIAHQLHGDAADQVPPLFDAVETSAWNERSLDVLQTSLHFFEGVEVMQHTEHQDDIVWFPDVIHFQTVALPDHVVGIVLLEKPLPPARSLGDE